MVVYKVDRLSRSLLDFSQLLEFFDKNNVVFVSVTQQFNTNTSMGRLTLNILLSFAQFEREIISERTKDKMGAARRRGQWLGGRNVPLRLYQGRKNRQTDNKPEEADIIKQIFELYLNGNSTRDVANILNGTCRKTRLYTAKSGKTFGNVRFTSNRISYILKNYTYLGKVEFDGKVYNGQQPAIIDESVFIKAKRKMAHYQTDRKPGPHQECSGLLTGILKRRRPAARP